MLLPLAVSPTPGQTGSCPLPPTEPQERDVPGKENRNPGFSKTESVVPTTENPRWVVWILKVYRNNLNAISLKIKGTHEVDVYSGHQPMLEALESSGDTSRSGRPEQELEQTFLPPSCTSLLQSWIILECRKSSVGRGWGWVGGSRFPCAVSGPGS